MKQVFIMRGIPGQGKSHLAKIIAQGLKDSLILSADDLRITDGEYQFNPERETDVWDEFENKVNQALEEGIENIIIDNTNLKKINYYFLKEDAIEKGYFVHEIIVGDFNVEKSYERGTHDVPLDKIQKMKEVFEFLGPLDKCETYQTEEQNDN